MATSFTNTPIDHTSDAGFRAWGSEFSGQLSSVGTTSGCLTRTADTGQINWVTVNRPGTNTAGGYENWQLTDSLGVSSPIYIKLEYGTGSGATIPAIWITVGTGTNGAGTLTGNTTTRVQACLPSTPASTVTNYPNYVCASEGYLGSVLKLGAATNGQPSGYFFVVRPCETDGTLRSDGVVVYFYGTSSASVVCESLNLVSGTKYGNTTNNKSFCMIPNEVVSTAVGSDIFSFRHFTAYPHVYSNNGLCTVLCNEMSQHAADSVALNGATPHTYLQLGADGTPRGITSAAFIPSSEPSSGRRGLCMLWE